MANRVGASQPYTFSQSSAAARLAASQPKVQGPTPAQIEAARKQQEALAKAAELQSMLNTLEKVNDEGRRSSLMDTLCAQGDVLNLPVYSNPPGKATGQLKVDLLKHQACMSWVDNWKWLLISVYS